METPIQRTGHGEEGGTEGFFARVDKIVGVLGSLGVYLPVEDVNLKIVEVLADDYEFEQRTILFSDGINRVEIEAIVRQRYTIMSRGASTKIRNVGQALVANKPDDRIRKQKDSDKGKPCLLYTSPSPRDS